MAKINLPGWQCERCGHVWVSRQDATEVPPRLPEVQESALGETSPETEKDGRQQEGMILPPKASCLEK